MKIFLTVFLALFISQSVHAVFPELIKIKVTKKDAIFSVLVGEDYVKERLSPEEINLLELVRGNDPEATEEMFLIVREFYLIERGIDITEWLH